MWLQQRERGTIIDLKINLKSVYLITYIISIISNVTSNRVFTSICYENKSPHCQSIDFLFFLSYPLVPRCEIDGIFTTKVKTKMKISASSKRWLRAMNFCLKWIFFLLRNCASLLWSFKHFGKFLTIER